MRYIYIVVKTKKFSENKVLDIVIIELWQLIYIVYIHLVTTVIIYIYIL